jgi:ferric-dicitrate binding protein FerR (iron transport regulator)
MKDYDLHKRNKIFLTGNNEVEGMSEEELSVKKGTDDFDLADDITDVMNKQKEALAYQEKELLGERITRSILNFKRRNLNVRISAAAVLLVIIGISVVIETRTDSEISVYARNMQQVVGVSDTRLILSGKKEVLIKSNDSKIAYAGNGNEIKVDSGVVRQDVEDGEMVYNTVIVPYGKRTQITLSDNSSVWLNSGSKLIYPAHFASNKREVYLDGEAIFEVSHNKQKPFHVVTHDVEVKVLGTVFDLSAYNDDKTTSTVLESGSVEMKELGQSIFNTSKATMVPGMMAVYSKEASEITQAKVDVKQYTSWRDGYISCEKQSLGDILKKISRYYNISIQVSDKSLENETFTGNLDLRNSATQVLAIIAEFINIKIENTNNQILITRV